MTSAAWSLTMAFVVMLPLMFLGVHIGVALALGAIAGIHAFTGSWTPALNLLLLQSIDVASSYTLMVIPLFIVLGTLASASGITTDLFTMFYRWFGHVRGGVAIATIGTCAGMASITGSSVATSAAMTRIALPELRRFGYSERLAVGAIANGGTLSIMIPPSITLVLYAIFAEQSVGKMLVAGVVPGLVLTLGFIAVIALQCRIRPQDGPPGPRFSWQERLQSLPGVLPFLLIVAAVITGILAGIWTPVESAAVAVVLVIAMGALRRRISIAALLAASREAVITSASIFTIVIGSMVFSNFLALNGISSDITDAIMGWQLPPFVLYGLLVLIYIALGMFMEVSSLMALTVPLVMPLVAAVGWNPIWFGAVIVLLMEIGMVTPPVGLNLYAVKAVAPDVSMKDIYLGSLPFWFMNIVVLVIFYFFPQIALLLPNLI